MKIVFCFVSLLVIIRLMPLILFIIVMPHSGIELYEYPLERDQKIYRKMIELGADLVVGSQPHCVQAKEIYLDKYIPDIISSFIKSFWSATNIIMKDIPMISNIAIIEYVIQDIKND